MATIGQQLTQPESGWRRIDSNDSRITYTGQYWQSRSYAGAWGGSDMLFNYSMTGQFKYESATFLFYGTKVRLIAQMDVNRSHIAEVIINEIVHGHCNQRLPTGSSQKNQMLVYEVTGLPQGIHKVSLRNITDRGMISLDAIDIDSDGRIFHIREKGTIKEIKEFGDRIIQRYTAAPNSLGVFTELGTTKAGLIPPASTPNPDGAFYWIYVDDDYLGRKKFIADRNIQNAISWDTLNTAGVAAASGIQPTKTIFSGTNYIDGGNAPDLFITGDITYGARFKLNRLPSSYACILNMVALGESLDTNTTYFLLINRNGGIRIGHEYGAGSDQIYETQGNYVKANEEISVTIVRDSPNKKYYVYINGEYKETLSYDYQPQIATSGNKHRLSIGMDAGSVSAGGYYMDGELYRLYIWDKACKSDEIAAYEKNKLTGRESRLVRLIDYPFDSDYKGIIRLPTGGINTTDTDNEWDRIIVNSNLNGTITRGDNNIWNWKGIESLTSTTPTGSPSARVHRGNGAVSSWANGASSVAIASRGFRPILLVEKSYTFQTHYLIEDQLTIKTVKEGQLTTIAAPPATKSMFLQGFQSLSDLTSDILSQLSPTAMLKIWTDDPQKTFSTLKTIGDVVVPYRYKVEVCHPERTVMEWTDFTKEDIRNTVVISPGYFTDLTERTVTVKVEQADSTLVTGTGTVSLYDTAPEIELSMVGLGFKASISDAEGDRVQYKVELNEKQIYPIYGGFSSLFISPVTFERSFMSREVNVNPSDFTTPNNTITLTARDEYGKESTATLEFAGTYSGILFADMDYTYYTSDLGDILRYLDVGVITAGQTTPSYPIRLINKHDFSLTNLEIFKGEGTLPKGTWVELSYADSPFIPLSSLTYDEELEYNGELLFHARIATDIESEPGDSTFDIYVKADPLR